MAFVPIYDTFAEKPRSQWFSNVKGAQLAALRDNFHISTWLFLGAFAQGILSLLPYRNIALVVPVTLILLYQATKTALQTFGLIRNPYMNGVIPNRTVPVFPDTHGNRSNPAEEQVTAIILAVRSNHPLGIFASGYEEVGNYFSSMMKQLEKDSTQSGFLGASSWLSTADRGVSSEYMTIIYFSSLEHLHAYAHGPLHTEAMTWWAKTEQRLPHIGIMHEVFAAPKHSWEGIYVNYHPTGLGATRKEVGVRGERVWVNPLVRGRGRLTYSKGRMGRAFSREEEWVALEKTLGVEEKA